MLNYLTVRAIKTTSGEAKLELNTLTHEEVKALLNSDPPGIPTYSMVTELPGVDGAIDYPDTTWLILKDPFLSHVVIPHPEIDID